MTSNLSDSFVVENTVSFVQKTDSRLRRSSVQGMARACGARHFHFFGVPLNAIFCLSKNGSSVEVSKGPNRKMLSSRALFCVALAVIACASVGERSLHDVVVLHLAAAAGWVPGVYGASATVVGTSSVGLGQRCSGPQRIFCTRGYPCDGWDRSAATCAAAVRARTTGCHSRRRRASGRRGERGFLRRGHFAEDRQSGTHV